MSLCLCSDALKNTDKSTENSIDKCTEKSTEKSTDKMANSANPCQTVSF